MVYKSPYVLEFPPHVLGFMTQGEIMTPDFQHYFKKVNDVYTRLLSLCGPPRVCVITTFLQEDCICVIEFIPESPVYHQRSIFTIRRVHLQKYRGITTRRAHLSKSRGMEY